MLKLVIHDDEGKTTVVPLARDEITIGRKEGNTIRLTERNVSRRHARIAKQDGGVTIEDLGSYNGIRVNNSRIAEKVTLRVSDQIQIGDYKLYLKTEGVDAVEDAKTMPHQRAIDDPSQPTTELMAVPSEDPTSEMPAVGPLGGDVVARPVVVHAEPTAATSAVPFGRLVIISSNFAGTEFTLHQPHMIIGRTSDNDIVIDHRSISRNHAKIVHEPDSNHFTVSDLQSSNGVRVNGQTYKKTELHRGDIVDLGHVRLRFIEPGEDFVFARDAEIADVPDGRRRSTLMLTGVMALLLMTLVAYMLVSNKRPKSTATPAVAVDAARPSADAGVVPADAPVPTAPVVAPMPVPPGADAPSESFTKAMQECRNLAGAQKWEEASICASGLLSSPGDVSAAQELVVHAKSEIQMRAVFAEMQKAAKGKQIAMVVAKYQQIGERSEYKAPAIDLYNRTKEQYLADTRARSRALGRAGKCAELGKLASSAGAVFAEAAAVAAETPCTEQVHAVPVAPPVPVPVKPVVADKPIIEDKPKCDPTALVATGRASLDSNPGAALKAFEDAKKCGSKEPRLEFLAGLAACIAHKADAAKRYYNLTSGQDQVRLVQRCGQEGITLP